MKIERFLILAAAVFVFSGVAQAQALPPTGTEPPLILNRPLYAGLSGNDVFALQEWLKKLGYFTYPVSTGYFGSFTWQAVVGFQKDFGVDPIGIVGPTTRGVIATVSSWFSNSSTNSRSTWSPGEPYTRVNVKSSRSAESSSSSSSSRTRGAATSSITQFGVTWTFDDEYEYGQFENGDYYVVGPVTIESVSPAWDGTKNGSMVDPVPLQAQGYDSRANYTFSSSNRTTFPVTLSATSSLVSTIGLSSCAVGGAAECLDTAAVLTVVSGPLPSGTFRPPYVAGTKPLWNTSDVDYDLLPDLPVPSGVTPIDLSGGTYMHRVWLDHGPKVTGATIHPQSNMPPYGRDLSTAASYMAAEALLDTAEAQDITNRLIQHGIDQYEVSLTNGDAWIARGGHNWGRKWPIVFAGIMLGDASMQAPDYYVSGSSGHLKFSEDGHTYYGQATTSYPNGRPMFGYDCTIESINSPWFGNHDCRDPNGLLEPAAMTDGGAYQECCTSKTGVGVALAAFKMNATSTWAHAAFFDYMDRWTNDPTMWTSSTTAFQQDANGYGGDGNGFMKAMWTTYRDITVPTLSSPTAASSSQSTADLSVSTNESNGTIYWVVTTSSTQPTKAQVKAGLNNSGTAAADDGSISVSSTGTKYASSTALTPQTTYYAHFMHQDTATNQSTVVTSSSFTTPAADVTAPTLSSASATSSSYSTADLYVTTNEGNGTLYWVVTTASTAPTATQVKAGQSHTGATSTNSGSQSISSTGTKYASSTSLTGQTTYYAHFMHEDAQSNQSTVLTSASFTTTAYSANAVDFDGTNDFLRANAGTLTFGSSKKGTFSMWFYIDEGAWPSDARYFFDLKTTAGTTRYTARTASSGRLIFTLDDANAASVFLYIMPTDTFAIRTWYHVAVSWDAASNSFQAFKNGTSLSPSVTVNNLTPDWSNTTRGDIGEPLLNGFVADVYLNTEEQIDLSGGANLAKFISGGKPVDLGANGSVPTGNQPEIFLSGSTASWETNKGTAGGFTENGALTTASSSPSD